MGSLEIVEAPSSRKPVVELIETRDDNPFELAMELFVVDSVPHE